MEEGELSEVFDRRFKHADVVLAGDVFVQAGADALAVAHFAEDPAVGGLSLIHIFRVRLPTVPTRQAPT